MVEKLLCLKKMCNLFQFKLEGERERERNRRRRDWVLQKRRAEMMLPENCIVKKRGEWHSLSWLFMDSVLSKWSSGPHLSVCSPAWWNAYWTYRIRMVKFTIRVSSCTLEFSLSTSCLHECPCIPDPHPLVNYGSIYIITSNKRTHNAVSTYWSVQLLLYVSYIHIHKQWTFWHINDSWNFSPNTPILLIHIRELSCNIFIHHFYD